jgi:hypothetical protein
MLELELKNLSKSTPLLHMVLALYAAIVAILFHSDHNMFRWNDGWAEWRESARGIGTLRGNSRHIVPLSS